MTTIAYDGNMVAADSFMFLDGVKSSCRKLEETETHVIGVCGEMADLPIFVQWFNSDQVTENKPLITESCFLVVGKMTGRCLIYAAKLEPIEYKQSHSYYAIGSGAKAALAAMMYGKNANEAIEIASEIDMYTGGEIDCIHLPHYAALSK